MHGYDNTVSCIRYSHTLIPSDHNYVDTYNIVIYPITTVLIVIYVRTQLPCYHNA